MTIGSGRWLASAVGLLLAMGLVADAAAQAGDYPSRSIKMIIPYAPGGTDDVTGRIVGKKLSEMFGQPVIVENHPGVGGTVAMGLTAKSTPDGYTIAVADSGQMSIAPSLYAKLAYQPLRDLTPVSNVALVPYVLAVNPKVPATTVKELIELAKAKKGSMTYGSTGTGGSTDLAMRLFKSLAGIDVLQVPYKGVSPYVTALLAGEIDMVISDLGILAPHGKAGKLRFLATASSKRAKSAPDLPTIAEAGVEGYAVDFWAGIVGPAGMPRPVVDKLNSSIVGALKAADVQQRFDDLGYMLVGGTPEQFAATIRADTEKYARVIKDANITPQ